MITIPALGVEDGGELVNGLAAVGGGGASVVGKQDLSLQMDQRVSESDNRGKKVFFHKKEHTYIQKF